jgi:hypothetical protein
MRKYTGVIEIRGEEMARSTPLQLNELRKWIAKKRAFYNKLFESNPWRIYYEIESGMTNVKKPNYDKEKV